MSCFLYYSNAQNDVKTNILKVTPAPVPTELIFCHKPLFYNDLCENQEDIQRMPSIENLIMLDVTKLPMNPDQWIHIDIVSTPFAIHEAVKIKIKYAMIQFSDSENQVIGRIAEQVPCIDSGHPQYMDGVGKMSQLYKNPGSFGIKVVECDTSDELSFNYPPTVGVFSFLNTSVEAFYVNMKFTKEEADFIRYHQKSRRFFITTLLIDEHNICYVHQVGQLDGIISQANYGNVPKGVPVDCHNPGENAFQIKMDQFRGSQLSPLFMNTLIRLRDVKFSGWEQGVRPRYRMPNIIDPQWNEELNLYNLVFNGLDGEGLTWEERQKRRIEPIGVRKELPLVVEDPDEETRISDKDCKKCVLIKTEIWLSNRKISINIKRIKFLNDS